MGWPFPPLTDPGFAQLAVSVLAWPIITLGWWRAVWEVKARGNWRP